MQISRERLALTSRDADAIIGSAQAIDGDYSLSAFLRAIVIDRGEWTVENLEDKSRFERVRVRTKDEMADYMTNGYRAVTIVECADCIDCEVSADGWTTFDQPPALVNRYLSQFAKSKVYINESAKRVVAFVDRRAHHIWVQAFQSLLFKIMPWYFPSPLSEDMHAVFKAISVDNKSVTPEDAMNAIIGYVDMAAKKINMRDLRLTKLLSGVADRKRSRDIVALEETYSNVMRKIRDLNETLADRYSEIEDVKLRLSGLRLTPANKDESMLKFFQQHKNIHVISVDDDSIKYGVESVLDFYDEDEFNSILENDDSYINDDFESDEVGAMKAIFADRKGLIRVNAVFELENLRLVRPLRDESFVEEAMPNPHIYFYACSGGNEQYYSKYAESGDWDLAIEQSIAATKNLNMGDSTVVERMINWLINNDSIKCIYVNDDGTAVNDIGENTKLVSFREFKKINGIGE